MVETRSSKKRKTLQTLYNDPHSDRPPPRQSPLDPFSALPDTVLIDILSLVPTKTAISTSVLSTRFRYIPTQLTNISLDCRDIPEQTADFYPLVDRLLTRNTSPRLRTFSVHVNNPRQRNFKHWLTILATRNIQNISITVENPPRQQGEYFRSGSPFTLPPSIFQIPSLVSLILPPNCVNYNLANNNTRDIISSKLPNLIKLELGLRASQCEFVAKLVKSCPLLEDLSLTAVKPWDNAPLIEISGRNLKRLRLDLLSVAENTKVVINARKLDWFYLIASQLGSCSFVKKPIALREALILTRSEPLILSLLPIISSVSKLHIYAVTFGLLEDFKEKQENSSIFDNLADLSLELNNDVDSLDSLRGGKKLEELAKFLKCNASILQRLTFHLIPVSKDEVNNKLEEMLFCIDLCSRVQKSLLRMIEFKGQYAKLPANKTALKKMEKKVKEIREFLSLQEIIKAM